MVKILYTHKDKMLAYRCEIGTVYEYDRRDDGLGNMYWDRCAEIDCDLAPLLFNMAQIPLPAEFKEDKNG